MVLLEIQFFQLSQNTLAVFWITPFGTQASVTLGTLNEALDIW